MNLVLSAFAATLALLVALEVLLPPTPIAEAPALPVSQPVALPPAATGADVETILQRPLFAESRRPPPGARSEAVVTADAMPRLSGIMITGADRRAIFEGSDKPAVAGVGGQVGGYRVVAIAPRQVTLLGPRGNQTISLTSDANHPTVSAPAEPTIIDRLNSGPPPPAAMPAMPSLQEMMSRLPEHL